MPELSSMEITAIVAGGLAAIILCVAIILCIIKLGIGSDPTKDDDGTTDVRADGVSEYFMVATDYHTADTVRATPLSKVDRGTVMEDKIPYRKVDDNDSQTTDEDTDVKISQENIVGKRHGQLITPALTNSEEDNAKQTNVSKTGNIDAIGLENFAYTMQSHEPDNNFQFRGGFVDSDQPIKLTVL
ncbi:uncharacterized protein LOC102800888 [Saccoglossus kowalevskii]|uniref:Uncharacterized protein LOC102800888 n=1 Tax=Saccoglossus kowalevskii TaxID=10224 RepID=A0ABM0MI29_SACKO|nr:PREDICTED: uncharacterized protein LOC102800888 [Saccoglossus kowalevskii]